MNESVRGEAPDPGRRARLGWRCRRGMKELDILLQRWLAARYDQASEVQRAAFEALLELPDPELAAYLLGGLRPADAGISDAVREILSG